MSPYFEEKRNKPMKGTTMLAVIEEAQPSLFAFKIKQPKSFPRLSFFAQDVIQHLIIKPSTAEEIAVAFNWEYDAVIDELRALHDAGLVATKQGSVDGDLACSFAGCEETPEDSAERGDQCDCEAGTLIDSCAWIYFGGPISEFFNYIQTKGITHGVRS